MKRVGVFLVVALAVGGCSEHNREAIESNNQGMALLRANRYADAREKFQRAAEEDPRYDVPLYNLALAFIRQRDWSNAADALSRAISRNPNNAEYHYRLGDAHYQIATAPENAENGQAGGHLEQARTAFQNAIQRNRNLYMAQLRLGQVAELLDDPQSALRAYTDTLNVTARAYPAYTRLGRLYYRNHRYDDAAQVLREGLRIAPEGVPERGQMHNYLGLTLLGQHQQLPAAEEFLSAIREDPNVHEALYSLGMTYAEMPDHHPQAILYLNQFIASRDPNLPRDFFDNAQNRLAELQNPTAQ
jgi:tetratricopeptide (TPR) repeat protein